MNQYFENNEALKSELRILSYPYKEHLLRFYSDLGVFSKGKIDAASQLLLTTLLAVESREDLKVLDVGCGYGFLGISLAKLLKAQVTLIDVNKRAIHLTKMNIKENKIKANSFISNAYTAVNDQYDLIITNPPIRAGKKVLHDILLGASVYLTETGELWLVINKNQGAKSMLKNLEKSYDCTIMAKSKGFYVIKCKKALTAKLD